MSNPYAPPESKPAPPAQQSHFLPLPLSAFITLGLLARMVWLYFDGAETVEITGVGCVALVTAIIAYGRLTE